MSDQARTVTTTIRITEDEAERLRKVAARDDRSMASVIRIAVRNYLRFAEEN